MSTLQILLLALGLIVWILTMALAWRAGSREGARSNPAYFLGRHDGYQEAMKASAGSIEVFNGTNPPSTKEKYSDHSNLHVIG